MANQHQQQHEKKVKNAYSHNERYDYVVVEFVSQNVSENQEKVQQENEQKYVMSAKVSRKERRKDRRARQNSWIVVNRPVSEFSVAESRVSH